MRKIMISSSTLFLLLTGQTVSHNKSNREQSNWIFIYPSKQWHGCSIFVESMLETDSQRNIYAVTENWKGKRGFSNKAREHLGGAWLSVQSMDVDIERTRTLLNFESQF